MFNVQNKFLVHQNNLTKATMADYIVHIRLYIISSTYTIYKKNYVSLQYIYLYVYCVRWYKYVYITQNLVYFIHKVQNVCSFFHHKLAMLTNIYVNEITLCCVCVPFQLFTTVIIIKAGLSEWIKQTCIRQEDTETMSMSIYNNFPNK